jgi:hypothetical protein
VDEPFLNALLKRGVIASDQVVNRSMAMVGPLKSYSFTPIWGQRKSVVVAARNLYRRPRTHD